MSKWQFPSQDTAPSRQANPLVLFVAALTNHRPNHEKLFYHALLKFREEQLENYPGSPLEYSASDYHHVTKPAPKPPVKRGLQPPGRAHIRRRSQFSIVSDENNHRDSYYKDPATSGSSTTKGSYDPYRSSRTPIVGGDAEHATIIVRKGSDLSKARIASQAGSVKRQAPSRLQADQLTSLPSQELEKLTHPKRPSHTPGTSRSSLASSRHGKGDSGIRKSASYKRQISFQHTRQKSSGTPGARRKLSGHQRLVSLEPESPEKSIHSVQGIIESQSTPSLPTPAHVARPRKPASELDMKKPRVTSHYWKDETRKVSAELGKICEEAFNRSSVSSSSMSHGHPADSPSTSVSTQGDTTAARLNHQLKERPLPQPPAESMGTYTMRELADLRRRLLENCQQEKLKDVPAYVKDTLVHLDKLLAIDQKVVDSGDKRSASDPTSTSSQTTKRHLTQSQRPRELNADGQFRAASDPVKLYNKVAFDDATIRVVTPDPSSPMQTIQPLNIRKTKTSASALRKESEDSLRRNYDRSVHESHYYGLGALDTIEEDPASPRKRGPPASPGGNRKWSWFKRSSDPQTDSAPIPPAKNSPVRPDWTELQKSNSEASSTLSKAKASMPANEDADAVLEKKKKWFQKMFNRNKSKENIQVPPMADHEVVNDLSETDSDRASSENALTGQTALKPMKLAKTSNITNVPEKPVRISQNWFARFFHVKPASKLICISTSKAKARKEVVKILKDWRKYGLRDVVSEKRPGSGDLIRGRVDVMNCEYTSTVDMVFC